MSGAPHLGGFPAIALFVAILVAAVVQSAITQVCRAITCFLYDADEVHQACTGLTWLPTAILALVSLIDSLIRPGNPVTHAITTLLRIASSNMCQHVV